jgi:myo-inositol-1(or 4)-monophosphatase
VVVNLASGVRFEAAREGGARCDGRPLQPSSSTSLEGTTIVGVSGRPPEGVGWFRALGAVALDLCAVAAGMLDGYIDASVDAHGAWDYLGGLLVCREAGAVIVDAKGRDLVVRGHDDRRTPVAAGTPELLAELLDRRSALP